MPQYIVIVKEIWIQPVRVEAENPDEARKAVLGEQGTYEDKGFELSGTTPPDTWEVEEI